jgi:hypothetical protein
MRIELTTRAWKALVLPLNYTRNMKILYVDCTPLLIFNRYAVSEDLESTSKVQPHLL